MAGACSLSSFWRDFLLGGVSGSIAKTAAAPLERVKLLLQVQSNAQSAGGEKPYAGLKDCFSRVYAEQGLTSFWRGNTSNVIRYFPMQALNFAFKEKYQKFFVRHDKKTHFWKFFGEMLAAGGAAGATSLAVVYPLDVARTRLATDTGKGDQREFTGIVDCCQKVYQKAGIKGLYPGFGASIVGIVVYRATFFGFYDTIKAMTQEKLSKASVSTKLKPVINFAVGFAAETFAGCAAYPFDTVRRRLMMQAGGKAKIYDGTIDCVTKIWTNEGPSAFFKGCFSNILRGVGGAGVVVIYDSMKKNLAAKDELKRRSA